MPAQVLSLEALLKREEEFRKLALSIDMTRGKPCPAQVQLSESMATIDLPFDAPTEEGTDLRNYGNPFGLLECKRLMGSLIGVDPDHVIVLGNSSLASMFSVMEHGYMRGFSGCAPWKDQGTIKWICLVPGYDRHFKVAEYFGFQLLAVPLHENGPDMDEIERLVSNDPAIKGIWCTPKFSNPTGCVYSDEVVRRFASLKPAAKDFRLFWDNAYAVHEFEPPVILLPEILSLSKDAGNEDLVIEFMSTSKITFPGSGICAIAASKNNLDSITQSMKVETIGFDKMNQMRHYLFLKNKEGVFAHMEKHGKILKPKFDLVEKILSEELTDLATWTTPKGGYFVCLKVPGLAKEVWERCRSLGVKFTEAGAPFPYGVDPENSYIRIAPTYVPLDELELAIRILCNSVQIESLLQKE